MRITAEAVERRHRRGSVLYDHISRLAAHVCRPTGEPVGLVLPMEDVASLEFFADFTARAWRHVRVIGISPFTQRPALQIGGIWIDVAPDVEAAVMNERSGPR